MKTKLVTVFVFLLIAHALTQVGHTKEHSPKIVPTGWVDDFSFEQPLPAYLKAQQHIASQSRHTTYVYLYSDRSVHCRKIRKLMKSERVRKAFSGSHIVMLEYAKFTELIGGLPGLDVDKDGRHWQPSLIKVGDDGLLTQDIIYPDLHLHHREKLPNSGAHKSTVSLKHSGYLRKAPYIRDMQQYFDKHR